MLIIHAVMDMELHKRKRNVYNKMGFNFSLDYYCARLRKEICICESRLKRQFPSASVCQCTSTFHPLVKSLYLGLCILCKYVLIILYNTFPITKFNTYILNINVVQIKF